MPNFQTLLKMQKDAGVAENVKTSAVPTQQSSVSTKTAGAPLPNLGGGQYSAPPQTVPTDSAYKLPGSGNPVYYTKEQLDQGLKTVDPNTGKPLFDQGQYDAALKSLQSGGQGVDPKGFGGPIMSGLDEMGNPIKVAGGSGIPQPSPVQTTPPPKFSNDTQKSIYDTQQQLSSLPAERDRAIAQIQAAGGDAYMVSQEYARKEERLKQNLADLKQKGLALEKQGKDEQIALDQNNIAGDGSTVPTKTDTTSSLPAGGDLTTPPASTKGHEAIDSAITTMNDALTSMRGMDPVTYQAYLPSILQRIRSAQDLRTQLATTQSADVTLDPTVQAASSSAAQTFQTQESRLIAEDKVAAEAKRIQLQTAKDIQEAAQLDQQIAKAKQQQDEQAQISLNIKNEADARRQLIKDGIADDTNGLKALSDTVQAGVSKLAALRETNNLTNLKANMVAGDAYTKAVDEALNTYEDNRAKRIALADDAESKASDVVTQKTAEAQKQKKEDIKSLQKDISTLEIEASDKIAAAQKALDDKANANRDDVRAQQQNLVAQWNSHISAFGSSDPDGARGIIANMQKLGMDTSGFNPNKPTLSQVENANKDAAKNLIGDNIGKYVDKASGQDLVSILDSSTRDLTAGRVPDVVNTGVKLLQEGKDKEFKALLLANARSGMDTQTNIEVKQSDGFLREMDKLEDLVGTLKSDDYGYWKSLFESGKTYAEVDKDPKFTQLKASIGFFQSQLRNKLFGASLTDNEKALADDFLANFQTDEMGTVVNKLNTLRDSLNTKVETVYDNQLGDGVYKNYIRGDGTKLSDIPDNAPIYTGNAADDYFKNPSGGPGAMRTDRNNNPTAMTVDVAKTGGLVEGVDYVPGDPFPNNPKLITAKLIGDPIATTIKAIDTMGFYTQKGQQRWTHTAIPKTKWDAMNYEQKAQVVKDMYKNEGGDGSLVSSIS